jgi:hypothetical protein
MSATTRLFGFYTRVGKAKWSSLGKWPVKWAESWVVMLATETNTLPGLGPEVRAL